MINFYEPIISNKDVKSVEKVIQKKMISGNNIIVSDFEEALAKFLDVKYVSVCSSGTSALHLALLALNLKQDDEVIMPSFSYIATSNSVKYVGAKPIYVDIDPETWQLDHNLIKSSITNKTKAIMPVHLYGGIPNIKEINQVAKEYNISLIHDAAESLGSKYLDKSSGALKDVSIFSFFPNKIITTGEGGMVSTNKKFIYEKVRKLRSQGLAGREEYVHDEIGYNYRMTALSAALGMSQLSEINNKLLIRKEQHEYYKEKLRDYVCFQKNLKEVDSSNWLTVLKLKNYKERIGLKKHLNNLKIETRNSFYPLHKQPVEKKIKKPQLSITEDISNKTLCIPSSPALKKNEVDFIIKSIKYFFQNKL